jgi:hypothetical protein
VIPNQNTIQKRGTVKSCKRLVDHPSNVVNLKSELYISQADRKADPLYAALFDIAKFAARYIKLSDERTNAVSEAVTLAWLYHLANPDKSAKDIEDMARRHVYKIEYRLRKRVDHEPQEDFKDHDPNDEEGGYGTSILDAGISVKQITTTKFYRRMEDGIVGRIDAQRKLVAIYRALKPEEFRFFFTYGGSRVTGRRHSPADRKTMQRIRAKVNAAGVDVT